MSTFNKDKMNRDLQEVATTARVAAQFTFFLFVAAVLATGMLVSENYFIRLIPVPAVLPPLSTVALTIGIFTPCMGTFIATYTRNFHEKAKVLDPSYLLGFLIKGVILIAMADGAVFLAEKVFAAQFFWVWWLAGAIIAISCFRIFSYFRDVTAPTEAESQHIRGALVNTFETAKLRAQALREQRDQTRSGS